MTTTIQKLDRVDTILSEVLKEMADGDNGIFYPRSIQGDLALAIHHIRSSACDLDDFRTVMSDKSGGKVDYDLTRGFV